MVSVGEIVPNFCKQILRGAEECAGQGFMGQGLEIITID